MPDLVASCAGSVKLYDLRTNISSAMVSLTFGRQLWDMLNSVVLCSANGASELGQGMMCFAGGANQSIYAWDLRGGHAKPLYELSTGNQTVESLAWHNGSNSLFAACHYVGEDSLHKSDFKRLPEAKKTEEDDDDDEDKDEDGKCRWWPCAARHQAYEFKQAYSQPASVLLRYNFSENANQMVPESPMPEFSGGGGGWW